VRRAEHGACLLGDAAPLLWLSSTQARCLYHQQAAAFEVQSPKGAPEGDKQMNPPPAYYFFIIHLVAPHPQTPVNAAPPWTQHLQATALGIAAYWSSWQPVARDSPEMKHFLGLEGEQVGY